MKIKKFTNYKLQNKLAVMYAGVLIVFSGVIASAIFGKSGDLGDAIYHENIEAVSNLSKFTVDTKYPGQWSEKNGKLYKGSMDMSKDNQTLDVIKNSTGYFVTIFDSDTAIATNVIGENGERAVGSKVTQEVVDTVINKGEVYSSVMNRVGIDMYVRYEPIKDIEGKNVGMFFTAVSKEVVDEKVGDTVKSALIIMIVLVIAGIVISIYIGKYIAEKVKIVNGHLTKMSEKDFTGELPEKVLISEDELGDMGRAAKKMSDNLTEVVNVINEASIGVDESMEKSNGVLGELRRESNEATHATQNIAATIEETASSMTNITEITRNIDKAINDISEKTVEGANQADIINRRAVELKKSADASQKLAVEVLRENKERIAKSIQRAKSIKEIEVLSNTIAKITDKTGLLSLNASIEASRAGEAGRGFSVVANEIKKLAEESQEAVSRIQETTERVVASVNELVESSSEIIEFMDKDVLDNLKKLVETGDQYNKDAEFVKEFTETLRENTTQLAEDMNEISQSISGIAEATNENANSVEKIAYNSESVTHKSEGVTELANETKVRVGKLREYMSMFKVKK